jgi:hypothetical protein
LFPVWGATYRSASATFDFTEQFSAKGLPGVCQENGSPAKPDRTSNMSEHSAECPLQTKNGLKPEFAIMFVIEIIAVILF